jgi:hypothetical protein
MCSLRLRNGVERWGGTRKMGTDMHAVGLGDDTVASDTDARAMPQTIRLGPEHELLLRELEQVMSPARFKEFCKALRRADFDLKVATSSF